MVRSVFQWQGDNIVSLHVMIWSRINMIHSKQFTFFDSIWFDMIWVVWFDVINIWRHQKYLMTWLSPLICEVDQSVFCRLTYIAIWDRFVDVEFCFEFYSSLSTHCFVGWFQHSLRKGCNWATENSSQQSDRDMSSKGHRHQSELAGINHQFAESRFNRHCMMHEFTSGQTSKLQLSQTFNRSPPSGGWTSGHQMQLGFFV